MDDFIVFAQNYDDFSILLFVIFFLSFLMTTIPLVNTFLSMPQIRRVPFVHISLISWFVSKIEKNDSNKACSGPNDTHPRNIFKHKNCSIFHAIYLFFFKWDPLYA